MLEHMQSEKKRGGGSEGKMRSEEESDTPTSEGTQIRLLKIPPDPAAKESPSVSSCTVSSVIIIRVRAR